MKQLLLLITTLIFAALKNACASAPSTIDRIQGNPGENYECNGYLGGLCTSGIGLDCCKTKNTCDNVEKKTNTLVCVKENNLIDETDVIKINPWKFSNERMVCENGGVAIGVCTSGGEGSCGENSNSSGIQCKTTESGNPILNTESGCVEFCVGFGEHAECGVGFGISEICSSNAQASCTGSPGCPSNAAQITSTYVKCCPLANRSTGDENEGGAVVAVGVTFGVLGFLLAGGLLVCYRKSTTSGKLATPTKNLFTDIFGTFGKDASSKPTQFFTGATSPSVFASGNNTMNGQLGYGMDAFLVNPDLLDIGPLLNKGGEGHIFKGSYAGSPVAIKEIMNSNNTLTEGFKREFQALKLIQHPNIIRLFGVCIKRSNDTGLNRYLLITEMAKCSLRDLISRSKTSNDLTIPRAIDIATQISYGCAFIHAQDMLHLDIKPENILLDNSGNVKICDLGLAKLCTSTDEQTGQRQKTISMVGIHGTPSYISPERVQDFQNAVAGATRRVSTAADVYSFAFVLWELLHHRKPHPREWDGYKIIAEMKIRNYRPEVSPTIPLPLSKTIRRCWTVDPSMRPTFLHIGKRLERVKSDLFPPTKFNSSAFSRISSMFRAGAFPKSLSKQPKPDNFDTLADNNYANKHQTPNVQPRLIQLQPATGRVTSLRDFRHQSMQAKPLIVPVYENQKY